MLLKQERHGENCQMTGGARARAEEGKAKATMSERASLANSADSETNESGGAACGPSIDACEATQNPQVSTLALLSRCSEWVMTPSCTTKNNAVAINSIQRRFVRNAGAVMEGV